MGYLITGIFGALVGSFLNVCIYRLPRDESVVRPRSRCPNCGKQIKAWENIPIISYIILRGKCSNCGDKISLRYPLVEIITVLLSIACWHHFSGPKYYLVYFLLFIAPLIVVFFVDLEHWIIPDSISISGIIIGLIVRTTFAFPGERLTNFIDSLGGAIIGGGFLLLVAAIYERIRKREGLGGGDVKLMAMLGAFFGWQAAIFMLFFSSFIGAIVGVAFMLFRRKSLTMAVPFGPFLVSAGMFWLFFGNRFLNWYLYNMGAY